MTGRVKIIYRIVSSSSSVNDLARKIAIEQSVECPESVITSEIECEVVPQIQAIQAVPNIANEFDVTLSYAVNVLSRQFNQLLNICFGNVSMYPGVRLVDIDIPDSLLKNFAGPQYGIQGIRETLGIYDRPLLATALKPRGQTPAYFAELAYEFAKAGGDIIKDDQNLIGDFDEFKQRTTVCRDAVNKAAQETGRRCLYFPFISAPYEDLEKYFNWVKELDLPGVLMCPLILGLDTARGLAKKYELIYMAHPAFTGSFCVAPQHGMNYQLLYGLLFRLAGADISVFPNQGGRFSFTQENCKSIANELTKPLGSLKAAFPCPAGGMQYDDLATMCEWFGPDAVFLLGGSLLEYSNSILQSTQAFKNKIEEIYPEKFITSNTTKAVSSCELQEATVDQIQEYLKFNNFQWQGRTTAAYKQSDQFSFAGISRVELVGKFDEQAKFDLRYFEIVADGYSSLEAHQHTHVIIVARGEGEVIIEDTSYKVKTNDVLYIKPNAMHQLKNSGQSAFGFYCIVDHDRDKPRVEQT